MIFLREFEHKHSVWSSYIKKLELKVHLLAFFLELLSVIHSPPQQMEFAQLSDFTKITGTLDKGLSEHWKLTTSVDYKYQTKSDHSIDWERVKGH